MTKIERQNAIMHALAAGEAFGLQVIQRVNENAGRVVLHQGNAYSLLRELEREGLISSRDGETTPDRGGRPRRYYRLTGRVREATAWGLITA